MVLSQAAKYAVRAVICVARVEEPPILGRDISARLDAPAHFLAKILQGLARQGILRSHKGRGGGFALGRPASEITVLEVIQCIEGPRFGEGCFLGLAACRPDSPCALHDEWDRVRSDLMAALGGNTVQHLLDGTTSLSFPDLQVGA